MVIMGFTLFRLPRPYSTPSRAFAPLQWLSILIVLAVLVATSRRANGYTLEGTRWPAGTVVTFQMGLGLAGRTLIDGNTSWTLRRLLPSVLGITLWPGCNILTPSPVLPFLPGRRQRSRLLQHRFRAKFGSGTLAVTYWRSSGSNTVEADILFNRNQQFDSYRGPLRFGSNGWAIGDIRRVLIHELGHALGLDHPDQHGQHVDAIMNSLTSDREMPSADDISGAQSMYGAPGPTPNADTDADTDAEPFRESFCHISTRMDVGTGNNVMIAGFIVSGSQSKR